MRVDSHLLDVDNLVLHRCSGYIVLEEEQRDNSPTIYCPTTSLFVPPIIMQAPAPNPLQ
jgi:hypothetical protein